MVEVVGVVWVVWIGEMVGVVSVVEADMVINPVFSIFMAMLI